MDDFITKPISSRNLYSAIESHLPEATAPATVAEPGPSIVAPAANEEPDEAALARSIALSRVGGLETTLGAIVRQFTVEAPRLLDAITQAIDARNAEELMRAAHTLKGGADVLALSDLVERALAVEQQGRRSDFDAARRDEPGLRTAVTAALSAVASW
jgi:HPt (histidine-containing phosphotransfer) domain-containing protein